MVASKAELGREQDGLASLRKCFPEKKQVICRQRQTPGSRDEKSLCPLPNICSIPPVHTPEGSRTGQVQHLSFLHTRKGFSRLQLFRGRLGVR